MFDPTSREHKKQLYPVLRALSDIDPRTTPELLIDKACGQPLHRGTDYIKNVAKGDFAKSIAQLVYVYLRDHHFGIAHTISPDIFPETPAMRWRQILKERAVIGNLKIVPMKREMGVAQRVRDIDTADTSLKLGQPFCLELTTEHDVHIILLQGIRDRWHPLPLVDAGEFPLKVHAGTHILPQLASGAPDPIAEHHDLGLHEFAVVMSGMSTIPLAVEKLVLWVNDNDCQMHGTKVTFFN